MSKLLKISNDVSLPLEAITERIAFLGQSGSGKTYAAMRFAELILDLLGWIIVLDPQGVWWGLLSRADGKASGYPVTVFGGRHAHVPIIPGAGRLVAEVIFSNKLRAVIDVSQMTMSDQVMFASAFAERLFELFAADPTPAHLFLEEAHTFLPQNLPPDGRGGDPRRSPAVMLNRFERIARQGRSQGIGLSMISQQPQAVNKKALNQAGTLFAMRTIGKHERKAIVDWMADKASDEGQLHLDQKLTKLETGEVWIASPNLLRTFTKSTITEKVTFDSSATPKFGEKQVVPKVLAKVDVDRLRDAMAAAVAEAEADDPKALKKKIAELERELKKKQPAAPAPKPQKAKLVEVPVVRPRERAAMDRLAKQLERIHSEIVALPSKLSPLRITAEDLKSKLGAVLSARVDDRPKLVAPNGHTNGTDYGPRVALIREAASSRLKADPRALAEIRNVTKVEYSDRAPAGARRIDAHPEAQPMPGLEKLTTGERRMLEAVAGEYPKPMTIKRLSAVMGIPVTHGSFRTWLPHLNALGLVRRDRGAELVSMTELGLTRVDPSAVGRPAPSGPELVAHWKRRLKLTAGEIRMLDIVLDHPGGIEREALAEHMGLHVDHGSFRTWLPHLNALELVSAPRGHGAVTPNPELLVAAS